MGKRRTTVCIGFSAKNVPLARPPGWEPDSWGYHGDDGDIYSGDKIGKPYEGKNFGPPDIIGCGVNFRTREAFFTKNGRQFSMYFRCIRARSLDVIRSVFNLEYRNCVSGHKGRSLPYRWHEETRGTHSRQLWPDEVHVPNR